MAVDFSSASDRSHITARGHSLEGARHFRQLRAAVVGVVVVGVVVVVVMAVVVVATAATAAAVMVEV